MGSLRVDTLQGQMGNALGMLNKSGLRRSRTRTSATRVMMGIGTSGNHIVHPCSMVVHIPNPIDLNPEAIFLDTDSDNLHFPKSYFPLLNHTEYRGVVVCEANLIVKPNGHQISFDFAGNSFALYQVDPMATVSDVTDRPIVSQIMAEHFRMPL